MPVGHRMRRQIKGIDKWMRRESYRWGQEVRWYTFDPSSVSDVTDGDIYDEGGLQARSWSSYTGTSRHWFAPRDVQVYMARIDEGARDFDETGTYQVDRLTVITNRQLLRNFGIDPDSDRVNDRIEFDGRLFHVNHFEKRGWISENHLTITVAGIEVMPDEQQTDDEPWYEGGPVPPAPIDTYGPSTDGFDTYGGYEP